MADGLNTPPDATGGLTGTAFSVLKREILECVRTWKKSHEVGIGSRIRIRSMDHNSIEKCSIS
jgi:hypothetical protein